MKRVFAVLTVLAACALVAADHYFDGTCDKDPLSYKAGEEMTFTITLKNKKSGDAPVKGHKVKWERRGDDNLTKSGVASTDEPLVIKTSIDRPGFVRITVLLLDENGKVVKKSKKFDGGACAEVNKLAMTEKPADFDKFWDAEYKKLLAAPY